MPLRKIRRLQIFNPWERERTGLLEICSCPQAIENSRQHSLLRLESETHSRWVPLYKVKSFLNAFPFTNIKMKIGLTLNNSMNRNLIRLSLVL